MEIELKNLRIEELKFNFPVFPFFNFVEVFPFCLVLFLVVGETDVLHVDDVLAYCVVDDVAKVGVAAQELGRGAAGGILRDVLINEVPLIFRKEIYALACVLGGIVFAICHKLGLDHTTTAVIAGASVITMRLLAVKYHLSLPKLKVEGSKEE